MRTKCSWDSLMNIRGTHSLRQLSMRDWPSGRWWTSDRHGLDTQQCVGSPRTMSCSLDCYQTLPWAATTFSGRDYWGLFHGVDENSCALLCEVSSCCEHGSYFHWRIGYAWWQSSLQLVLGQMGTQESNHATLLELLSEPSSIHLPASFNLPSISSHLTHTNWHTDNSPKATARRARNVRICAAWQCKSHLMS
jgi:hypothetical protein